MSRSAPDPVSDQKANTGWHVVAGIVSLVIVAGMIVFGVRVTKFGDGSNPSPLDAPRQ